MMQWEFHNGIYELALAKEPCNEIGTSMLEGLERFLKEIQPEKAHTLIIHSKLKSGFCAGADLRELYQEILARPQEHHQKDLKNFLDRIHNVMTTLDTLPLTTIGVIHGICFGGGFELALTCDLLIAENTARFCFPELRLGIIPGFGGIPRLKREVSNAIVRDLLMTGRSINAQKAQQIGLVSQIVVTGEGLSVARRTAEQIGKFDPTARIQAKKFIKDFPTEELKKEKKIFLELFQSPTVVESLKKFVESRDVQPYLP